MDLSYYDDLYFEENDRYNRYKNNGYRYDGYNCNICNRTCDKMNKITCKSCLESQNIWKASNNSLFEPACTYCVKKWDLCTKNKQSYFCKIYLKKLNCSTKYCVNHNGKQNASIYIDRATKSNNGMEQAKLQWRSAFYGYELEEKYLTSISINDQNISPRKIANKWYRIFCKNCTSKLFKCKYKGCNNQEIKGSKFCRNHSQCIVCNQYINEWKICACNVCGNPCHFSYRSKCGTNGRCIDCHKKIQAKRLIKLIKMDVKNQQQYTQYINNQRQIIYHETINVLNTKFLHDISCIIIDLCVGEDIAVDMMKRLHCNCGSIDVNSSCYVIRGVGSKLYFTRPALHYSYYILDEEYIEELSVDLMKYGVQKIGDDYYRILCKRSIGSKRRRGGTRLRNCKEIGCDNMDITAYCRNHQKCTICNEYLINEHNECKLKEKGQILLDSVKKQMNNELVYNQYIVDEMKNLYDPIKRAIKSSNRFCDGITDIIFDLCVGDNIGADLMILVKCCGYNSCYAMRGIGSNLCFIHPDLGDNRVINWDNYMLNDRYIDNLLLFEKVISDKKQILERYGIREIQGCYFRVFCRTTRKCRRTTRKCRKNGCNNCDVTEYCRNHLICVLCDQYVFATNDSSGRCEYCCKIYCKQCLSSLKHGMYCYQECQE